VVGCSSFHADVHAGNLLVLRDGRIAFIDFGIVGKISPKTWQALEGIIQVYISGMFVGICMYICIYMYIHLAQHVAGA